LINFYKCILFSKIIGDIIKYQNQDLFDMGLEKYDYLNNLLLNVTYLSEKEMYKMSLLREEKNSRYINKKIF
jgi:hypothetical protein